MKRFVFDNLVYKMNETSFLVMNLISFRRETITKDTLDQESELHLSKLPVRSITFNLTHSCNFNCDYCYQRKYKYKPEYAGSMGVEDIRMIMEYLQLPYFGDTALEELVVSGGESLLPSNIDTINYICDHVAAKKKILFTNGSHVLAYKDKIDIDAFDEYQISLDGPDTVIRLVNHHGDSYDKG